MQTNRNLVKHLRRSRHYGKELLYMAPELGSVLISHKIIVETEINENETMISTIDMLPVTRLYRSKNDKIVDDGNLLNEDVEAGRWD